MLQQVYNTARVQQEVQQEYSKRYSKFIRYSFINTYNTINTIKTHDKNFIMHSFFF